jgi:TRAP-type mannitol/chloroaromatic compound transport system substrate-binding protein
VIKICTTFSGELDGKTKTQAQGWQQKEARSLEDPPQNKLTIICALPQL